MDEKLMKLIENANHQIHGLQWTLRKQAHLKGVLAIREQDTENSIKEIIDYVKSNY